MRYEVRFSKFHGGGVESTHRSLKEAIRITIRQAQWTDCICGCLYVIDTLKPEISHAELEHIVRTNQVKEYEAQD